MIYFGIIKLILVGDPLTLQRHNPRRKRATLVMKFDISIANITFDGHVLG